MEHSLAADGPADEGQPDHADQSDQQRRLPQLLHPLKIKVLRRRHLCFLD
jgi:hypothetical protein